MSAKRRVRLFENDRTQAVRIPREFEPPGQEAILSKEGDRLLLVPASPRALLTVLDELEPLDNEFPSIEELPLDSLDVGCAPGGHTPEAWGLLWDRARESAAE